MSFTSVSTRKLIAAVTLPGAAAMIVFIFWKHELKYSLPTPVPAHYSEVHAGDKVDLPKQFEKGPAYFLHFYNPDCPCSRFNARHIKSLIGNYHDSIKFAIVVTSRVALEKAQDEFGADLKYIEDNNSEIANAVGVYSTPQAAIITHDGKLFYRGNYNSARYCTSRASNFAELSLVALINNQNAPPFGIAATQSYGCELNQSGPEFF